MSWQRLFFKITVLRRYERHGNVCFSRLHPNWQKNYSVDSCLTSGDTCDWKTKQNSNDLELYGELRDHKNELLYGQIEKSRSQSMRTKYCRFQKLRCAQKYRMSSILHETCLETLEYFIISLSTMFGEVWTRFGLIKIFGD